MPKPTDHNERFRTSYPDIWDAFSKLATECHEGGPLDERSRRLIKIALAVGAGLEGATHSAVRHAREGAVRDEEMRHIALLAVTTLGFPSAMRALSWIAHD
jgi:alkylhydroperoxidase/carboxymuconolactone decarboxylase family protein YurZ